MPNGAAGNFTNGASAPSSQPVPITAPPDGTAGIAPRPTSGGVSAAIQPPAGCSGYLPSRISRADVATPSGDLDVDHPPERAVETAARPDGEDRVRRDPLGLTARPAHDRDVHRLGPDLVEVRPDLRRHVPDRVRLRECGLHRQQRCDRRDRACCRARRRRAARRPSRSRTSRPRRPRTAPARRTASTAGDSAGAARRTRRARRPSARAQRRTRAASRRARIDAPARRGKLLGATVCGSRLRLAEGSAAYAGLPSVFCPGFHSTGQRSPVCSACTRRSVSLTDRPSRSALYDAC